MAGVQSSDAEVILRFMSSTNQKNLIPPVSRRPGSTESRTQSTAQDGRNMPGQCSNYPSYPQTSYGPDHQQTPYGSNNQQPPYEPAYGPDHRTSRSDYRRTPYEPEHQRPPFAQSSYPAQLSTYPLSSGHGGPPAAALPARPPLGSVRPFQPQVNLVEYREQLQQFRRGPPQEPSAPLAPLQQALDNFAQAGTISASPRRLQREPYAEAYPGPERSLPPPRLQDYPALGSIAAPSHPVSLAAAPSSSASGKRPMVEERETGVRRPKSQRVVDGTSVTISNEARRSAAGGPASSSHMLGQPSSSSPPQEEAVGWVFGCNDSTVEEVWSRMLFGGPEASYAKALSTIQLGRSMLFLYNYSSRTLQGVFTASETGMNLERGAFKRQGKGFQGSPFPVQVRVEWALRCPELTEAEFGPILLKPAAQHSKFKYMLGQLPPDTTAALLEAVCDKTLLFGRTALPALAPAAPTQVLPNPAAVRVPLLSASKDAHATLRGRSGRGCHLFLLGDANMRQVYFSLIALLQGVASDQPPRDKIVYSTPSSQAQFLLEHRYATVPALGSSVYFFHLSSLDTPYMDECLQEIAKYCRVAGAGGSTVGQQEAVVVVGSCFWDLHPGGGGTALRLLREYFKKVASAAAKLRALQATLAPCHLVWQTGLPVAPRAAAYVDVHGGQASPGTVGESIHVANAFAVEHMLSNSISVVDAWRIGARELGHMSVDGFAWSLEVHREIVCTLLELVKSIRQYWEAN